MNKNLLEEKNFLHLKKQLLINNGNFLILDLNIEKKEEELYEKGQSIVYLMGKNFDEEEEIKIIDELNNPNYEFIIRRKEEKILERKKKISALTKEYEEEINENVNLGVKMNV